MALFDKIKSTVLTEYKADTRDMRKGLRDLKGEELKRHKALVDQTEAQNKKLDGQIEMWGKVAVGVGAVVAAYKVLSAGAEVYAKNSRLMAATVGVDLDGLRKATNGLVDDTRLLEFAASGMNGTFKLTQQQMEGSLRGVLAFRKEGNDLEKTLDNVQKALAEGTVEPLKELGHVIKGVENDTREGLNAALLELTDTARKSGPNLRIPGDEMTQASVDMDNAVDGLMHSLGGLAQALSPVITQMANLVSLMVAAHKAAVDFFSGTGGSEMRQTSPAGAAQDAIKRKEREIKALGFHDNASNRRAIAKLEGELESLRSFLDKARQREEDSRVFGPHLSEMAPVPVQSSPRTGRKTGGKTGSRRDGVDFLFGEKPGLDIAGKTGDLFGLAGAGASGVVGRATDAAANENKLAAEAAAAKELADQVERVAAIAGQHAKEDSIMSQIFGAPSEIDAQSAALQGLASTFDGLAGAFVAGVDALITGSSSFADAFKNAIGESLRAMAVEMSIGALKHTAYGLASLAFLDGRGAAAHFSAAGTFAAGAVAAGAGARLLGAGQAQAPAPSTAGSAGVGTSGGFSAGGDNKGQTTIMILGNDFVGMNARQRAAMVRDTSRKAGFTIDSDAVQDG
jgi:hypothetical protein